MSKGHKKFQEAEKEKELAKERLKNATKSLKKIVKRANGKIPGATEFFPFEEIDLRA